MASRTLTHLYNVYPTWLQEAHRKLDEAVFAGYGWPITLTDGEILGRLLILNHERASLDLGSQLTVPCSSRDGNVFPFGRRATDRLCVQGKQLQLLLFPGQAELFGRGRDTKHKGLLPYGYDGKHSRNTILPPLAFHPP